jgi:hypothetical protein
MKEIFVSVSGPIEGNHGPCKSRAIRGYKQHCRQEQFAEGLYSESNGRFITPILFTAKSTSIKGVRGQFSAYALQAASPIVGAWRAI